MYVLNQHLRLGDIILVRGAAKHSKVIAEITNGHFSHAMIALENGVFLEAITDSGVQRTSSLRVSFQDKSNVAVLRYNFPNQEIESQVLTYISANSAKYQGQKYNIIGAIQSTQAKDMSQSSKGYFCSHLIASIYADAGFPLLNKSAHKITPNELLESVFLNNITEEIIIPISDIEKKREEAGQLTFKCLDAGGTTLSQDAKNHRIFINDTAKYFRKAGLDVPNNAPEIPLILLNESNTSNAKKVDYQISKIYKKIGINKYISNNISGVSDHSLVIAQVMAEFDENGEDCTHTLYHDYCYKFISTLSKRYMLVKHQQLFNRIREQYQFRFFELRLEYYTIAVNAINSLIEEFEYILKSIETRFPLHEEEFKKIKQIVSVSVIEELKDPEVRSALITSLGTSLNLKTLSSSE